MRVRQAMSYAFDYDEMLEHDLLRPVPASAADRSIPTSWMFPKNGPQPYQQDLDKAEDLLDEAGWTDSDGDGIRDKEINGRRVPFEFTLLTYQTETGMQASHVAEGVPRKDRRHLQRQADGVHRARRNRMQQHKFEAAMGGWGIGHRSRLRTTNIFGTGEGRNYGSYSNPQVDELFEQGRRRVRSAKSGPRSTARSTTSDVGRSALHVAVLPQLVLRLQQEAARLQLQPARAVPL